MSFRSLLVMLGSLLVHVLRNGVFRHGVFLAIWGSLDQRLQLSMVPNYLDGSEVRCAMLRMFRFACSARRPTPEMMRYRRRGRRGSEFFFSFFSFSFSLLPSSAGSCRIRVPVPLDITRLADFDDSFAI